MSTARKTAFALLLVLSAALALVACGSDSSTTPEPTPAVTATPTPVPNNARYVGGRWRVLDINTPGEGWELVFKADNTFDGYVLDEAAVKIVGTYSVDDTFNLTGNWTSRTSSRVGRIEARFETDTVIYFKFIETNAYDNPRAVDGVVWTEHRGSRV